MVDATANEKSGTRSIASLECLYDVIATVRGALGKLRAHACYCATELDLQGNPRMRLDERGISGLLGEVLVKFSIAHGICLRISAPQSGPGFKKYILEPPVSWSLICGTASSTAKHSSRLNSS
jgi:hypothetical protein